MKKFILSIFAVCLALGVSAQQTPDVKAKANVAMENIRVGKTLSDKQQEDMYNVVFKYETAVAESKFADKNAQNAALRETQQAVDAIFTPEQKSARQEYFKKLAEKRAAEAANR